jgi:hypothetical protein
MYWCRFEDAFVGVEEAEQMRTLTAMYVDESIQQMSAAPPPRQERRAAVKKLKALKRGIGSTTPSTFVDAGLKSSKGKSITDDDDDEVV